MTTLTLSPAFDEDGLGQLMHHIGTSARAASDALSQAASESKDHALRQTAANLRARAYDILLANARDIDGARQKRLAPAFIDRLTLTPERVEAMAVGLEEVAGFPDPVGQVIAEWDRPNGLRISRVRTPLGVIGVIFESRPNVTADAGGLCLKAGNATVLRCGSDSLLTSSIIAECLTAGVMAAGLPDTSVQLVPTSDRRAVGEMLKMSDCIDVIVPRGGRALVERVASESRIPVFKHSDGICHTYVHAAADVEVACRVVFNAKMRRPGICGATETLLVDRAIAGKVLPPLLNNLLGAGCEVRGDAYTRCLDTRVRPVSEQDWDTEYLDKILSAKVVDSFDEAVLHIKKHSSKHTDAIITTDANIAAAFVSALDSAILMVNASTQFADGGEFGMGAEIGISTGKLHARGPVGVEQLTSFKYIVRGNGQCRT